MTNKENYHFLKLKKDQYQDLKDPVMNRNIDIKFKHIQL